MGARIATAVVGVALAATVGGCWLVPGATPDDAMRLEMANGTTIPVVLSVNGGVGRSFDAGGAADLGVAEIGPPPWDAIVRTSGGRILLTLRVEPGSVSTEETSSRGVGARVDLSCGRIDLWSGPPMLGPAPGPGVAGDCDP